MYRVPYSDHLPYILVTVLTGMSCIASTISDVEQFIYVLTISMSLFQNCLFRFLFILSAEGEARSWVAYRLPQTLIAEDELEILIFLSLPL